MTRGVDHTVNIFGDTPQRRPLPDGGIYTKVVGVVANKDAQKFIAKIDLYGIRYLRPVRDPNNDHDSNAIKIVLPASTASVEYLVGYLDRHLAARLAPLVDQRRSHLRCRVEGVTGKDKEYQGVNVVLYFDDGFDLTPYHPRLKRPRRAGRWTP